MQNLLPWIIAGLSALAVLGLAAALLLRRPRRERKPLPTEWSLNARPVFSADERRVFRLLREALPHHVVMCKLPMVRFCQPTEARDVRYWYELLGGISVNFAICSPNGRVLAAIDIETDRPGSARSLQIKQAVLAACRIRYLRSSVDNLPTATELQLLVPYSNQGSRAGMAAMPRAGASHLPSAPPVAPRRAAPAAPATSRNTLWNDSPVFSDSFSRPTAATTPSAANRCRRRCRPRSRAPAATVRAPARRTPRPSATPSCATRMRATLWGARRSSATPSSATRSSVATSRPCPASSRTPTSAAWWSTRPATGGAKLRPCPLFEDTTAPRRRFCCPLRSDD
ncbi:DUF2726 domain-containing protein [Roseateles chitinivorans]|uniref:DUF2726 domain-containing protein n=1 Tax=Roseateles chitinivorans TaxID=2917965 RepID=UPI003D66BB47